MTSQRRVALLSILIFRAAKTQTRAEGRGGGMGSWVVYFRRHGDKDPEVSSYVSESESKATGSLMEPLQACFLQARPARAR